MRMMAMLLMIMMMMMMIMIIMVSNGSHQPGQRPPIVLGCNVSSLYMDKAPVHFQISKAPVIQAGYLTARNA